jgi:hypothetical protein
MDFAIDPIVHGDTVSSTTNPARDLNQGDKGSGDASHKSQSVKQSIVTDADSDNKTETGRVESHPSPSTATTPIVSPTATSASTNKSDQEDQPGNLEAREEGQAESNKRKRAETFARTVARLMDSDEERERWRAALDHFEAEQSRRDALFPQVREQGNTDHSASTASTPRKLTLNLFPSGTDNR